jgi:hypothetical protein
MLKAAIKNFINTPSNRSAIAAVQGLGELAIKNQILSDSANLTQYYTLCKIKELVSGTDFEVTDISELLEDEKTNKS